MKKLLSNFVLLSITLLVFQCKSTQEPVAEGPTAPKDRTDLPPPVLAAIKDKSWTKTKLVAETWMLVRSKSSGADKKAALAQGEKKASYMALMATTGARYSESSLKNLKDKAVYEFKVTGGRMIEDDCKGSKPATCAFTYMIHLKDLRAIDLK
jgi:hypothetical protein